MAILRALPACLISAWLTVPAALAEPVTLQLKNGDTLHGELVVEESTEELTVVMHPQLGRLEISAEDIRPKEKPPAWKSSLAAGVIGNDQDGDSTVTANLNASSVYRGEKDKLTLKGSIDYKRNHDKGESPEVKTEKGSASARYDVFVSPSVTIFSKADYGYNGLNDSSINKLDGTIGVGFPLLKSETAELILSVGPTVHWTEGGKDCDTNEFCGNTYGGGSFITELNWTPNRSFRFTLNNDLALLAASEVKPTNKFSAVLKYFPSFNSGLFTSVKYESIYDSTATPESNNTVSGQVGLEF